MRAEGFAPRCHATAFQPVAPTDDCFQRRYVSTLFAGLILASCECGEGVGDEDAGSGAEAVVVEHEMFERNMFGEKVDQGGLGV